MGASGAADPENGNTLRYRVGELERELSRQRDRVHSLAAELGAHRLLLQSVSDKVSALVEKIENDVTSIKRLLITFMFTVMGSVIAFALSVFMLVGD